MEKNQTVSRDKVLTHFQACLLTPQLGSFSGSEDLYNLALGTNEYCASEPVFLNVYGAQESIPRNEFRQPM
jgi:hypothetical protein